MPVSGSCPVNIDSVHDVILSDSRTGLEKISEALKISYDRVDYLVQFDLDMRRISAEWSSYVWMLTRCVSNNMRVRSVLGLIRMQTSYYYRWSLDKFQRARNKAAIDKTGTLQNLKNFMFQNLLEELLLQFFKEFSGISKGKSWLIFWIRVEQ